MKRLLVLVALAGLVFAGFHFQKSEPVPAAATQAIPQETPSPEEEPVLTANGRPVPCWLYDYWFNQACANVQAQYQEADKTPDWTATGPGSLRQGVLDQALSDAVLCALVEDWALTRGCALTPEDHASLELLWQQRTQAHGGEEAYLKSLGLTRSQAWHLGELGQYYRKLHQQAADPSSPYAPTPEQLSDLAEADQYLGINRISVTGEDAPARIAALFSRLNQAPDPAALFPTLAAEGEDHLGPRTVRIGDGQLSPQLEEAALALEVGHHSGILSDGTGCAILLRTTPSLPLLTAQWMDRQLTEAVLQADVRLLPAFPQDFIPPQA